jgi:hypothetical protein
MAQLDRNARARISIVSTLPGSEGAKLTWLAEAMESRLRFGRKDGVPFALVFIPVFILKCTRLVKRNTKMLFSTCLQDGELRNCHPLSSKDCTEAKNNDIL